MADLAYIGTDGKTRYTPHKVLFVLIPEAFNDYTLEDLSYIDELRVAKNTFMIQKLKLNHEFNVNFTEIALFLGAYHMNFECKVLMLNDLDEDFLIDFNVEYNKADYVIINTHKSATNILRDLMHLLPEDKIGDELTIEHEYLELKSNKSYKSVHDLPIVKEAIGFKFKYDYTQFGNIEFLPLFLISDNENEFLKSLFNANVDGLYEANVNVKYVMSSNTFHKYKKYYTIFKNRFNNFKGFYIQITDFDNIKSILDNLDYVEYIHLDYNEPTLPTIDKILNNIKDKNTKLILECNYDDDYVRNTIINFGYENIKYLAFLDITFSKYPNSDHYEELISLNKQIIFNI